MLILSKYLLSKRVVQIKKRISYEYNDTTLWSDSKNLEIGRSIDSINRWEIATLTERRGIMENYKTPSTKWEEERGKKKEEDSRKWRTWLVKNHGQFRDNQVFPSMLVQTSRARKTLNNLTPSPFLINFLFWEREKLPSSSPSYLSTHLLHPFPHPPSPSSDTEAPLKKFARGRGASEERNRVETNARDQSAPLALIGRSWLFLWRYTTTRWLSRRWDASASLDI